MQPESRPAFYCMKQQCAWLQDNACQFHGHCPAGLQLQSSSDCQGCPLILNPAYVHGKKPLHAEMVQLDKCTISNHREEGSTVGA